MTDDVKAHRRTLAALKERRAGVERDLEQLDTAIHAVERMIGKEAPRKRATVKAVLASGVPEPRRASVAPPRKPLSIANAAHVVLKAMGRPMGVEEIMQGIVERNLVGGRELKRTSVVSALDAKYHDATNQWFDKPKPGLYGLPNGAK